MLFCVVLSSVHRCFQMSRFPVQGVLPKCLNGFIVSKVISESEKGRRA